MDAKRNGEIDLLRFVFAVIILIHHYNALFKLGIFEHGYIGVEFFFVVSGFLMARHAVRSTVDSGDLNGIADETWRYLTQRVRGFYAYYLLAAFLQVIVRYVIVTYIGKTRLMFGFLQSIPTFSLTFMGLNSSQTGLYVGNTWYLSSMLIAIFLLYPLLLRRRKFAAAVVFPAVALFVLGYLYAENSSVAVWENWSGLAYYGVLRAVGEMALGASLFRLSCYLTEKRPRLLYADNRLAGIAVTFFKAFCFAVVIAFASGSILGKPFERSFNLHALLWCALGILLSFSDVGYSIPDSRVTRYLGKLSLPLFLFHGFIRWTVWEYIGHPISVKLFAGLVVMTVAVSIALMYLTDFLTAWLGARRKKD